MKKVIVLVLLVSCGYRGEDDLYGAHLVVDAGEAGTPYGDVVNDLELRSRVKRVIERSADYWGVGPTFVDGFRIVIKPDYVWCHGGGGHDGCADWLNYTVSVSLKHGPCIEFSPLLHELGHVAFFPWGDPWHWDDLWWNDERMSETWRLMQTEDIPEGEICRDMQPGGHPPLWKG